MLFWKHPIYGIQFSFLWSLQLTFLNFLCTCIFLFVLFFIKYCVRERAFRKIQFWNCSTIICKGCLKSFHNHFLKFRDFLYVYRWVSSCCLSVKVVRKQKVVYRTKIICWNFFIWFHNRDRRKLFVLHILLSISHNRK